MRAFGDKSLHRKCSGRRSVSYSVSIMRFDIMEFCTTGQAVALWGSGIGRPFGLRKCTVLRRPAAAMAASLAFER